jgi:hypothetical protein
VLWPILAKLAKNANASELWRKGRKREKARNDEDFRIIPGLPITDQGSQLALQDFEWVG